MERDSFLKKVRKKGTWDIIVIGGGATGLGVAVDAASRGYKTLLLEQSDFAKGTSSRSTKLVHGGVRYLQQGDIALVMEALRERGLMISNAPHLVSNRSFVIPSYEWWGSSFYTMGLKVYDLLAGKLGLGSSRMLNREEAMEAMPTLVQEGLKGGTIYHDGQFDDARMAISLAQTCADHGGVLLNYCQVTALLHEKEQVCGVTATDQLTGEEFRLKARAVVNATGVFVDEIMKMDDPESREMITPSQGIHLVVDRSFLPQDAAVMVPNTSDGRVMFAVPWRNHVIIGTTDTPISAHSLEPVPLEEEVEFLLKTAGEYLVRPPERKDVLSVFAGLRPLARPDDEKKSTKEISRSHKIIVSMSGLVTITGGKWTTYRKMAEDVVEKAAILGGLPERACFTPHLPIHGFRTGLDPTGDPMACYGTDREEVLALADENPYWGGWLSQKLEILRLQVIWAVREEMAESVEDVLARRTRALFLDARESIRLAPAVALLMAREKGKNKAWEEDQVAAFTALAQNYLLSPR